MCRVVRCCTGVVLLHICLSIDREGDNENEWCLDGCIFMGVSECNPRYIHTEEQYLGVHVVRYIQVVTVEGGGHRRIIMRERSLLRWVR